MGDGSLRHVVHKRVHLERHQPKHRRRLGYLEKHKDYVKRAKDFHKKEDIIKGLQRKAYFKNEDEFAYGMMSHSTTKDGKKLKKKGHLSQALLLVGTAWQQFAVDAVCLGATVAACAVSSAWEQGLSVLMQSCRLKLRANVIMYSSIITSCENAGEWEVALRILEVPLVQAAPNVVPLSSAVSTFEKRCRWQSEDSRIFSALAMPADGSANDPHQQAQEVHDVLHGVGDHWYVLSMRWWDLWRDYTLYDKPAVPAQPALSRSWSGTAKGERPAEIDNSDLLPRPDCTRLQSGLVENQDFILLHEEAWKKLHGWYGGGPALRRRVIGSWENRAQLRVELYPLCLTVFQVDDYGNPDRDRPMQIMPSTHETVEQALGEADAMDSSVSITNLDLRDPDGVHAVRLWHRPNFELDQTSLDSLEGWEQLEMESTLEDVADGASILLERSRGETWPFFQRLRLEYKRQNFKDLPLECSAAVGDKIDASTTTEEQKWDSYQRDYVWKDVLHWYAATVAEAEETRLLVQFHNRPKPKGKSLSIASLLVEGEKAEPIEVGKNYESLDSRGNWHQVNITAENDDKTFEAQLLDEPSTWPVVQPENDAEQAFEKVFARYGSNGVIERGGLRGLLSCATNEYIPEEKL
eukprot:s558_g18.t1